MISVVLLSHQSEKCIAKSLDSIAWCDEVVVVDDYSTDKTVEIAKKHKAIVYEHPLNGDFAAQRNFALGKAKGPWVLFVDADEVVSPALAAEIRSVTASSQNNSNFKFQTSNSPSGYYVRRSDFMWGRELRHGETSGVRLLRLAKKDAGRWERSVHEVWKVKGGLRELSEPLLHYPHPNVAQFLDHINFYSSLNAQYLFRKKVVSPSWRIVVNPVAKFIQNYFFRLGFLDGTPGAIVAIMMSFHSFLTRGKLYFLYHPYEKR